MTELFNDNERFETIYGYDIKHLCIIAMALRKSGISPDNVKTLILDTRRFMDICWEEEKDHFEQIVRWLVEGVKETEETPDTEGNE